MIDSKEQRTKKKKHIKNIYLQDSKDFYTNLRKYFNRNNVIVHYKYNDMDIIDDTYSKNNKCSQEVLFKIAAINATNIKNIKERYSYIYDTVCEYLDNEFKNKNICGFCNGKCISSTNNSYFSESQSGCCYGRQRGVCKYLKNNKCSIKSISCKLFTCRYLKNKNIKYNVNDIPLLKYFFNIKQKYIISMSIFKDKEEVIELLMKNRYLPRF